jgi:DNA mismatch repair ATPase MutS
MDIAESFIREGMVRSIQSLTLFITHYQHLSRMVHSFPDKALRNVNNSGGQVRQARNVQPVTAMCNTLSNLIEERDLLIPILVLVTCLREPHMDFTETGNKDKDGDEEITFLYEVAEGVAHRSYGLNVASRLAIETTLIIKDATNCRNKPSQPFPPDRLLQLSNKDKDGDEEITFLYEVAEGVAHRSYGLNVARLANLPTLRRALSGKECTMRERCW